MTILGLLLVGKQKKNKLFIEIKDENLYPACKIYGECERYGEKYIGKIVQNTVTRWSEHNPEDKSEPIEHIKKNMEYVFK